jgi:uncharacterized repeat protein (TIGR03803 family)
MKQIFTLLFLANSLILISQYTKLLDFDIINGKHPEGSLISDGTYLYGMTPYGGSNGYGTLFKIKSDGSGFEKIIDFEGLNGKEPHGSLIFHGSYLFGMTMFGGTNNQGIIFKIKPDGTDFNVLYEFNGQDGGRPNGSLYYDGNYLFGMTTFGGTNSSNNGQGVIFKIKPDGTEFTKLHDFNCTNGGDPYGSLISDGIHLFGMTTECGINDLDVNGYGDGILFKIKKDGSDFTKILDFNGTNGDSPWGSLFYDGNYLIGMTIAGGLNDNPGMGYPEGIIFRIKPDGTEFSKIFDFDGSNGGNPYGSIISDGIHLYGMTRYMGVNGRGVVFKINSDGTDYVKLFDFNGTNGEQPWGDLFIEGTKLFGMTSKGGSDYIEFGDGNGVIFKIDLGQLTITDIEANQNEILLFPNPNNGNFKISGMTFQTKSIKISNLWEEIIFQTIDFKEENEIDLSNQPGGIYILEIIGENTKVLKKIVKQ